MPQHDFSQIRNQYQQVIGQMRTEFTSHQFIFTLAQQHQRLYVEALYTYRHSASPFQTVHGLLARMLRDFADYLGEVSSKDIWDKPNRCAKWRRR